jgi:flagellar basal body L-ring protein FlgH
MNTGLKKRGWIWLALAMGMPTGVAVAQSSSLFLQSQNRKMAMAATTTRPGQNGSIRVNAGTTGSRTATNQNPTLAAASLTSITPPEPSEIKVNDLVGVVIRERMRYQSNGRNEQKSEWDLSTKLNAYFRLHEHKWLQQDFGGGAPNIDLANKNELKNSGKYDRQDVFETRVMGKIVDVKPNGNLIIVAMGKIKVEDEFKNITMTGECNKIDIAADRTVTSDKIFNPQIEVEAAGSVTDGTKRGWFKQLFDKAKAF